MCKLKEYVLSLLCFFAMGMHSHLIAQSPAQVGTAGGWGGNAVLESRFSESAWWNPALPVLPDVPLSSFSLLSTSVDAKLKSADYSTFFPASSLFFEDQGSFDIVKHFGASGDPVFQGNATVQWFGGTTNGTAISLITSASSRLRISERVRRIASGEDVPPAEAPDTETATSSSSGYNLYSTLLLSKAGYAGHSRILGPIWIGVSGKASVVHLNASGYAVYGPAESIGSSLMASPDIDAPESEAFLYNVYEVKNTKVLGVDAGIVFNPVRPVLVSISGKNLYQTTSLPDNALNRLQIWFLGASNGEAVATFARDTITLSSIDSAQHREASELISKTRFTRMLQLGASLDLREVRVSIMGGIPLEEYRGAIDESTDSRWAVSLSRNVKGAPRISLTEYLDSQRQVAIGGRLLRCGGALHWNVLYNVGEKRGLGIGAGYTVGPEYGCQRR